MGNTGPSFNTRRELLKVVGKTLLIPVLVLAFFWIAPRWFGSDLRTSIVDEIRTSTDLTPTEKAEEIDYTVHTDFAQVWATGQPPKVYHFLEENGLTDTFDRLWLGWMCSLVLVGLIVACMALVWILNRNAGQSQLQLIRNFRLAWRITVTVAIIKLVLLIPLLAYGTFECSVLLIHAYSIKLLLCIIVLGLAALWACITTLMRKVPLEFSEPMACEVTETDAPELWHAIRTAARQVGTAPPDRVAIGMQFNFYVTELAVLIEGARLEGRTLYISYPLLRQMSVEEVIGIIGHELGHFKGNDTRLTRELYPLKFRAGQTMNALTAASWAGWASLGLLGFFWLSFEDTLQRLSRARELEADAEGAAITSPENMSRGLLKFHVLDEVFNRIVGRHETADGQSLLNVRWHAFIADKIPAADPFWNLLGQRHLPHPLDSHPPLADRLAALGGAALLSEARTLALQEAASAFDVWFASREDLFGKITAQASERLAEIKAQTQLREADVATQEGRELLESRFPEQQWARRPETAWRAVLGGGVAALVCLGICLCVPWRSESLVIFALLVPLVVIFTVVAWQGWKSFGETLVLRMDGIHFSKWNRPLPFDQVKDLTIQGADGKFHLRFILKEPAEPFFHSFFSVNGNREVRAVKLVIGKVWNADMAYIVQKIHTYYFRVMPQ